MAERKPWIMRTYSGHSTPAASNALYRKNLEKGQTGLSVAFDLPTQTGYDPDHPLARGEVGKVGVPVAHLGDMRALFADIPLERMNTSMTINATAPWLFALYLALAEERGLDVTTLAGTTQNDLVKEYLSRGTYVFAPEHSLRLTSDVVTYAVERVPEWNPTNVCSYHLQEAGATPVQELAYALLTAMGVLDRVRASGAGQAADFDLGKVVGRISFFVNAGVRFVEEMCKMRAFGQMWERLTRDRYGVTSEKLRRFRYGVQVNSLGLTAAQPENNVVRIVLEMLAVTLSEKARARAVQLPAWNEALGLPRPWDQQWSLRAQQILAYESDLLEYPDLFDGSKVVEAKVAELTAGAWAEIAFILGADAGAAATEAVDVTALLGGPPVTDRLVEAIASGAIKERLVGSNAARLARIEAGEQVVVGVNRYRETEASPLTDGGKESILRVDPDVEREAHARLDAWRGSRDGARVASALEALSAAASSGANVMPASIACAHAGVTTGEWAGTLRKVFGEWRAPTGVVSASAGGYVHGGGGGAAANEIAALRAEVRQLGVELGRPPKMLVGKPGLDGHSNGAEQIALRARDAGFEVVYDGIRVSPEELVTSAIEEGVHLVGLSILSGSHLELVPAILRGLREAGAEIPVVVGGIIPDEDAARLRALGVARVFTPKDFAVGDILHELVAVVRAAQASTAA